MPKLQVLIISSNHLTDLEGIEACPELNTLVCSGNKLATLASVRHLRQCPYLNTLDLQSNLLEDPEVHSQQLYQCPHLITLDLQTVLLEVSYIPTWARERAIHASEESIDFQWVFTYAAWTSNSTNMRDRRWSAGGGGGESAVRVVQPLHQRQSHDGADTQLPQGADRCTAKAGLHGRSPSL